ncbi:serine/threonine protein kinase [Novimethylophilus kurashikiensis]|uniref:Serine/threonine protein kinase n=2 Tax=Novimethylophilus kurashikiensis TaxID=1825523 RepID=A0A2R5F6Z4_9PROT|nr:serine/threonine-protein kinase [Novimethylophilus kurashikiensis]GBG13967.1 serine/threonine protein kinase [Novimethylophilus kurashikiensis]
MHIMSAQPPNHSLPVGYQLQEYRIDKVLSGGGFSYVYLAHDQDGQAVAIKEYLPSALALRVEGNSVVAASDEALGYFRQGMKSFFEEGRALARIDHRNIVRVINFFRANDTVYMVMQYERGRSLQTHIQMQPQPVTENFVRRVFGELLTGLREVHTHKLLHLDIKPANIYLRIDGSPVLLDFGSARQGLSDAPPSLAPTYTPGYAAPEQYSNREGLGPWSDIYSIGATMYACLTRSPPPPADDRIKLDKLTPAVQVGKGIYSTHLLETIDWCLELDHLKRPQSVFALQKALLEDIAIQTQPQKNSLFSSLRAKLSALKS